ncbi:DNA glycosylase [Hypoxylon fragiforme]|uniref:DNA glycosylase n=1 Tax=Hypoxylon fragiforme TaxID=63214 RepID=UPI0020C5B523|nr:DNA glycosylase [Hypoxylon fragiforme]KAI2605782.1 DNA glycosylase [Hypoxylon fragiforme]
MPPRAVVSPPRRITRSSLARFRHGDNNSSSSKENSTPPPYTAAAAAAAVDIEDVIPSSTRKRKRTVTLVKKEEEEKLLVDLKENVTSTSTQKPRRERKPARKAIDAATGETKVTAPSDWEQMYDAVKAMRLDGGPASNAAVDTMGCERLADPTATPRDRRYQTLVALMLSSQTKDTTNAVVMRRLQTELPPHCPGAPAGLNLENMLAVDPETLNQMIWAVGFHNNKTKYLQQAAAILRDQWDGDIPDTIAGLVALPGVGPKMAHLCMSVAWNRTEGIGVDVHVHRITNLWGWHATKGPEETRLALQSWLPRDRWREINWLLVGFGQTVCLPVGRRCGDCELGLRGLCRAAERKKVLEGRKVWGAMATTTTTTTTATAVKVPGKTDEDDDDDKALVKVKVKEEEHVEEMEKIERDVVVNKSIKKEEDEEEEKKEPGTADTLDVDDEERPESAPGQREVPAKKPRRSSKRGV